MSIDWREAPEGWRLVPVHPTQEMRAAAGRAESNHTANRKTFFAGDAWVPMVANAPKYVADQWQGEGLPPVGQDAEFKGHDGQWLPGQYIGQFNGQMVVGCHKTGVVGFLSSEEFRPIRTPEQIAADERQEAIQQMREAAGSSNAYPFEQLYDAGYRKVVTP